MKKLRKLYYKYFERYKIVETKFVSWIEAEKMLKQNLTKFSEDQWVLAKEEDNNPIIGMVYLCRKERITE